MQVDKELVTKLATLSKLEFTENEKEAFVEDFQKILNFVEQLNEVDTTGVEPLEYITDRKNVLREDIQQEHLVKEKVLSNAPLADSDYFKVPKVVKQ